MHELETIVRQLEAGRVGLDQTIQAYERGALLKQHCETLLGQAQARDRRDQRRTAEEAAGPPAHRGAGAMTDDVPLKPPPTNARRAIRLAACAVAACLVGFTIVHLGKVIAANHRDILTKQLTDGCLANISTARGAPSLPCSYNGDDAGRPCTQRATGFGYTPWSATETDVLMQSATPEELQLCTCISTRSSDNSAQAQTTFMTLRQTRKTAESFKTTLRRRREAMRRRDQRRKEHCAVADRGASAMTEDTAPPFEQATAELRKLGITLARLPGEYRVNFSNANDATARTLETLDEALAAGRAMAAERTKANSTRGRGPRRRRPRRMTPKAYNKRLRLAHMRRLRARARREQRPAVTGSDDKAGLEMARPSPRGELPARGFD